MQLGVKMQTLFVVIDQPDCRAHRHVRRKLAQITHMRFRGEEGSVPFARVIGTEADEEEGFIDRAIDQYVVIGHVEVAVVVDPGGIDGHHGRYERREEYGFEIDTSRHRCWRSVSPPGGQMMQREL